MKLMTATDNNGTEVGFYTPEKAVYDAQTKERLDQKIASMKTAIEGIPSVFVLTQEEYDALTTKDPNTLYFIKEVV